MFKIYNLIISNLFVVFYLIKISLKKSNEYNYEAIIFSYNRPLQLSALLKSLTIFLDSRIKINILIKYDNQSMKKSYEKLYKTFQGFSYFKFIEQNQSFKSSLNNLITKIEKESKMDTNLLFFVDDQILFKKIKLKTLSNLNKLSPITTLRIGLNTNWSYNLNKKQSLENYNFKKKDEYLFWYPKFINDDISYIFSFDGSTIPLYLFKLFCRYLIYYGPNSLETSMNYGGIMYKILKGKVSSKKEQSVINIVISNVQKETINKGIFVDINKLQLLFDENWELKLDHDQINFFNSPHLDNGVFIQKENIKKLL